MMRLVLVLFILAVLTACVHSGSVNCRMTEERVWSCSAKGQGDAP